jgi:GH24 family phage-related lysozyme (muramidase)
VILFTDPVYDAADSRGLPMLNWNEIDDDDAYQAARFDLLKLLEGSTRRPYVDGVGDPTIGIGFNLVYNLEPVMRIIVGAGNWSDTLFKRVKAEIDRSYQPGDGERLVANLDRVMAEWHNKRDSDVPAQFGFRNDAQVAKALDALAPQYDRIIESWVGDIPDSDERAALFSLAWNAPGLLGPKLKAAIDTGDRPEAWYEIRYNSLSSSLPDGLKGAIANRRYAEADTFGLYDGDGRATFAQALDAGRMVAAHHTAILAYEDTFDPLQAASIKGVDSIQALSGELQPAIKAVLRRLDLTVDHRLETLLVADGQRRNLAGEGTGHDSSGNDDDLLLGDKTANRIDGGGGRDVLAGMEGADLLTGGKGADIFVFSEGDSPTTGRIDRIADFGSGSDRIALNSFELDFDILGEGRPFTGARSEIRWIEKAGKTIVEIDADADGEADLRVALLGKTEISADDFLF